MITSDDLCHYSYSYSYILLHQNRYIKKIINAKPLFTFACLTLNSELLNSRNCT